MLPPPPQFGIRAMRHQKRRHDASEYYGSFSERIFFEENNHPIPTTPNEAMPSLSAFRGLACLPASQLHFEHGTFLGTARKTFREQLNTNTKKMHVSFGLVEIGKKSKISERKGILNALFSGISESTV